MSDFDPDQAVKEYRDVITWRDESTDVIARSEFQAVADLLRDQWKRWNGDDDLHETAFGERFVE